ncbi:hypothetical protein PPHE_a3828 [Pseudoalteromonas phenolica O-BC30]|nr:hypothetical protein [Pseudoalteromonas phenolica O-BC30]
MNSYAGSKSERQGAPEVTEASQQEKVSAWMRDGTQLHG